MNSHLKWFRRPVRDGVSRTSRRRSFRTEMEWLEGRSLLSATSAVSWASNGVAHNTLYAIDKNDSVEVSTDGGSFTSLNFYAKQISASLDASGKPEVYAIASDNSVVVNRGAGWVGLGGYVKQISATVANTVYAIGKDNGVYINRGTGTGLFPVGPVGTYAKQISAGADAAGNPEVFGIGANDSVFLIRGASNVNVPLGGYAKQISATMNNTVYVIGQADSVFVNRGAGFVPLGGYVKQISASLDATGKPEVFAVGSDDALWVNHATGPDSTGSGFVRLGGYATEVSAPAVGIALPGDQAYVVGKGHGGSLHRGTSFIPIGGGTIE
jgi:hypothetical protein